MRKLQKRIKKFLLRQNRKSTCSACGNKMFKEERNCKTEGNLLMTKEEAIKLRNCLSSLIDGKTNWDYPFVRHEGSMSLRLKEDGMEVHVGDSDYYQFTDYRCLPPHD